MPSRKRKPEPFRITSPAASAILEMEGMVPTGTTAQLVKDNAYLAKHGKLPPLSKKRGPKRKKLAR